MIESKQHRSRPARGLAAALAAASFAFAACSDGGGETPAPAKPAASKPATSTPDAAPKPPAAPSPEPVAETPADPAQLAKRGRTVYMANCIACHSQDPAQDGALGPAVAGSSRELLEARVMRGEYPEGYTPKRPSKVMIPLPHLEGELDALAAFLATSG
jgi:mono/diheme cytochrome c family protein